jgi:ribosomal-protein-alanine N-acetyltransferase
VRERNDKERDEAMTEKSLVSTSSCVHVRWMIRRDLPDVLAIDRASFAVAWTHDDFIRYLQQRENLGMVAETDDCILGFMLYELRTKEIAVDRFAVHPHCRRMGVGRKMSDRLFSRLTPRRRTRAVIDVRESNLPAQLFFRSLGWTAGVVRGWFEDEDAYRFVLREPTS